MPMNKQAMAQAIIGGFSNPDKPDQAMKQFCKSLKKYIEDNMVIMYSWAGTNPSSGAPDPVVTFKSSIKFPVFNLSNPQNLTVFGIFLAQAIFGGIIKHAAGFTLPPGKLLMIPIQFSKSNKDNQREAMEHIAGEIISGIKKMKNPVPLAGAHAAFTGAATMTQIL
jgi:hypothetical protein